MTFGNFENKFRHTAFLNMDPGSEIADVTSTEMPFGDFGNRILCWSNNCSDRLRLH
jgi:hypothetical protein